MTPERSSENRGLTLVELLVVVLIIAVLAVIALPQYQKFRSRGYRAALQSDLRNLAPLQEDFHGDSSYYASDPGALNFVPSQGVVVTINESTALGWAATAQHVSLPTEQCGFYFGQANPANAVPAVEGGVVTCTF